MFTLGVGLGVGGDGLGGERVERVKGRKGGELEDMGIGWCLMAAVCSLNLQPGLTFQGHIYIDTCTLGRRVA